MEAPFKHLALRQIKYQAHMLTKGSVTDVTTAPSKMSFKSIVQEET